MLTSIETSFQDRAIDVAISDDPTQEVEESSPVSGVVFPTLVWLVQWILQEESQTLTKNEKRKNYKQVYVHPWR